MAKLIDHFPTVTVDQVRVAVGGRKKMRKLKTCAIDLPDGRVVEVGIVLHPNTLGGHRIYFACPVCGKKCLSLRVVPFEPGLWCIDDLRKSGWKFWSQTYAGQRSSGLAGSASRASPARVSLAND